MSEELSRWGVPGSELLASHLRLQESPDSREQIGSPDQGCCWLEFDAESAGQWGELGDESDGGSLP